MVAYAKAVLSVTWHQNQPSASRSFRSSNIIWPGLIPMPGKDGWGKFDKSIIMLDECVAFGFVVEGPQLVGRLIYWLGTAGDGQAPDKWAFVGFSGLAGE